MTHQTVENQLASYRQRIEEVAFKSFNKKLDAEIDQISRIAIEIRSVLSSYAGKNSNAENTLEKLNNYLSFSKELIDLNNRFFKWKEQRKFREEHDEFIRHCSALVDDIPETVLLIQSDNRFKWQPDDKSIIRLVKIPKKIFFFISRRPDHLMNFFRRIFKKEVKPVTNWKYNLPLKRLVSYYLLYQLPLRLISRMEESKKAISASLIKLWELEVKIVTPDTGDLPPFAFRDSIDTLIIELENLKKKIREKTVTDVDETFLQLNDLYPVAGTIEMPAYKWRPGKLSRKIKSLEKKYGKVFSGWRNNIYALSEDWTLDLELEIYRVKTLISLEEIIGLLKNKVENSMKAGFGQMSRLASETESVILKPQNEKQDFIKQLNQQKYLLQKSLTRDLIPPLTENILNQNLPGLIDKYQNSVKDSLMEFGNDHWLVSKPDYNLPFTGKDLVQVKVQELIEFESYPRFEKNLSEVKNELFRTVESIYSEINNIDQVFFFSLDTAKSLLEDETKSVEDAKIIAREGFERISNKINEFNHSAGFISNEFIQKLRDTSTAFTGTIGDLKDNENLLQIKLRITKAKAVSRSLEIRHVIFNKFRNYFEIIQQPVVKYYRTGKTRFDRIASLYLGRRRSVATSGEVKKVLSDMARQSTRLSFTYQRLFKVEPLTDSSLFVGRQRELEQLKSAFTNWELGHNSSTVIISEKGGGLTSLLNQIDGKLPGYKIIRLKTMTTIFEIREFLNLLNETLGITFNSPDEVTDYFNDPGNKKIIILEDFHKFYLRKINGFNCLTWILQLISLTGKNTLWLCSTNLYPWQLLDKTVHINSYFTYIVRLNEFTDDEIIELIMRRNRISGYGLYFKPSDADLKDGKYQKLSESDRQEYLKRKFFSKLNNYARSNLALALTYWLQSSVDVTKGTITVSYFEEPDLDFLSTLSKETVFTLHTMILHDGITEEHYALLNNMELKTARSKLSLLQENGILIRRGEEYIINPMVYRSLVSLLKLKNLIY